MTAPDGFREFVEANSRILLRTAWLLCGDWSTAEDLVQIALAAAWPRWSALSAPEAYVRRVLATSYLRSRKRRWTGEVASESVPDAVSPDSTADVVARQVLLAALATLPHQQRAAVVLRYFADQSEADTAAALGCSVGAVKSHTARAIARLRTIPDVADLLTEGTPS